MTTLLLLTLGAVQPLLAPHRRRVARRAIAMSDAAQPVLWGENLIKSHDGTRRQLDDASLVLREGQRCCVVGHNGCGKSTLLDIISGGDRPDGGGVRLKRGVKVTAVPQEPLVAPEDASAGDEVESGSMMLADDTRLLCERLSASEGREARHASAC